MVSGEPEVFEEEDADVVVKSNRSSHLLKKGIVTGRDFANVMSALMTDLADGSITPPVGNAISKAGSQIRTGIGRFEIGQIINERKGSSLREPFLSGGDIRCPI